MGSGDHVGPEELPTMRLQPSTKARFASRAVATSVVGAMFAAGRVSIWSMHSGIGGVTVRARRDGPWFDLSQSEVDGFVGASAR